MSKNEIVNLYWEQKLSIREVAEKLNTTYWKVWSIMEKYKIPRRPHMPKSAKGLKITKETLIELYVNQELTLQEIGKSIGCHGGNIFYWMKKYEIPRRSHSEAILKSDWSVKPKLSPSPELAYVLGVILGDGSVSYNEKKYRYRIKLDATDKAFVEFFKDTLEKIGLHPSRIKPMKQRKKKHKTKYRVIATSKRFAKWFKGLILEDIEKIVSADEESKISFIRGFYESEGSCRPDTRWKRPYYYLRIGNTNEALSILFKSLVKDFGFETSLYSGLYESGIKYEVRVLGGEEETHRFLKLIKPCTKLPM